MHSTDHPVYKCLYPILLNHMGAKLSPAAQIPTRSCERKNDQAVRRQQDDGSLLNEPCVKLRCSSTLQQPSHASSGCMSLKLTHSGEKVWISKCVSFTESVSIILMLNVAPLTELMPKSPTSPRFTSAYNHQYYTFEMVKAGVLKLQNFISQLTQIKQMLVQMRNGNGTSEIPLPYTTKFSKTCNAVYKCRHLGHNTKYKEKHLQLNSTTLRQTTLYIHNENVLLKLCSYITKIPATTNISNEKCRRSAPPPQVGFPLG